MHKFYDAEMDVTYRILEHYHAFQFFLPPFFNKIHCSLAMRPSNKYMFRSYSILKVIKNTIVQKTIRAEKMFDLLMHNNFAHLFCKCMSQDSDP